MPGAVPPLDAHDVMRAAGWEPLDPYPVCAVPMHSPWRCRCQRCGRERLMTISLAQRGERCAYCTARPERSDSSSVVDMKLAPGLTFSWKRALGITALKRKISKATGIPLTRAGRQRKLGRWLGMK